MIPIRDALPARRKAIATWGLVIGTTLVFAMVQPKPVDSPLAQDFLYANATIPCEVTTGDPLGLEEFISGECSSDVSSPIHADKSVALSLLASLFLHGDWIHLGANMWILWIFGNNVEDAFGHVRYAMFYVGTGLAASLVHIAARASETVPVVGASGAIAGVMGAYLVLYPRAKIVSIVPPFVFFPFRVPAFVFLPLWLLAQFGLAGAATNIAWEAHVGGFIAGALIGGAVRATAQPADTVTFSY